MEKEPERMLGERNSHILLGSQLQTQSSNWAPDPPQGARQHQGGSRVPFGISAAAAETTAPALGVSAASLL